MAATGDAGSSTAELALITPLLVMFLLLVVLCGRLVSAQIDLDAAASAASSGRVPRPHRDRRPDRGRSAALDTLSGRGADLPDADRDAQRRLHPGWGGHRAGVLPGPAGDLVLARYAGQPHRRRPGHIAQSISGEEQVREQSIRGWGGASAVGPEVTPDRSPRSPWCSARHCSPSPGSSSTVGWPCRRRSKPSTRRRPPPGRRPGTRPAPISNHGRRPARSNQCGRDRRDVAWPAPDSTARSARRSTVVTVTVHRVTDTQLLQLVGVDELQVSATASAAAVQTHHRARSDPYRFVIGSSLGGSSTMLRVLVRWIRALLASGVLAGLVVGVPSLLVLTAGWPLAWTGWSDPATSRAPTTSHGPDQPLVRRDDAGCARLPRMGVVGAVRPGRHRRDHHRLGPRVRDPFGPTRPRTTSRTGTPVRGNPRRRDPRGDPVGRRPRRPRPVRGLGRRRRRANPGGRRGPRSRRVGHVGGSHPDGGGVTITENAEDVPGWAADAPGGVYRVVRGDNLWDIAESQLGDPYRWREIYQLNRGQTQANGHILTDPDRIDIGWVLALPAQDPERSVPTVTPEADSSSPDPSGSNTPSSPDESSSSGETTTPGGSPSTASPEVSVTASPESTPSAEPSPTATSMASANADDDQTDDHQSASDGDTLDHTAMVGVPLLGAGLLAALLLTILHHHRRRREQYRPVGRRAAEPVTPRLETSLRVVAQPLATERLDHALRQLAAALANRPPERTPDIVGAWSRADAITLLLTEPCHDPPEPWRDDGNGWTLPEEATLAEADGQLAPLPTLATIASRPGTHLLIDLERLGLLTITGNLTRAGDLMRYLAVELACNTWSDHVEVIVAGFDPDETSRLISLGGERVEAAPSVAAAVDRIRRRTGQVGQSLERLGVGDPLVGRIADLAADAWMPLVLLAHRPGAEETAALAALDGVLGAAGRRAVAVVATADPSAGGGPVGRWAVAIDESGRLDIPFLDGAGDEDALTAAGLPRAELGSLAELLASTRANSNHRPRATPPGVEEAERASDEWPPTPPAPEPEPWAQGTDLAGGLPIKTPEPQSQSQPQSQSDIVIPRPCDGRRDADPSLDDDVRAWNDADPTRPRIAILGPVVVHARGKAPEERPRFYAEIIAYLASRGRRGASTDQFDDALWPDQRVKATTRRVAVARARRWLGEGPDGRPWLPDATADHRYRLREGYLLDWHLFRRLRTRGESLGPDGVIDLHQALDLIRGAPLAGADIAHSSAARNPYAWLPVSDIPPHHLVAAIVDTAHRLVDLCLHSGDVVGARRAVERAHAADPERASDVTWRDHLRVAAAEGNTAELDQLLDDLMVARDAEVPEDLAPDTYQLLRDLIPDRMRAGVR